MYSIPFWEFKFCYDNIYVFGQKKSDFGGESQIYTH